MMCEHVCCLFKAEWVRICDSQSCAIQNQKHTLDYMREPMVLHFEIEDAQARMKIHQIKTCETMMCEHACCLCKAVWVRMSGWRN